MNEVIIPPSPNWYNDSLMVCTPDGYLIYASRKDIVILKPKDQSEPAEFNIIHNAHSDRVIGVNINNLSWGDPKKLIVSIGEDNIVNVWDFNLNFVMAHKRHESSNSNIVSASFAGERIVSVTKTGQIAVWRTIDNVVQILPNIFIMKVKVMCMALSPHVVYLAAFGLASGLVVIADLRGNGTVLYRMRQHDHDITALSWCPTPYNIFKTVSGKKFMESFKKKQNRVIINKNAESSKSDNTSDISEERNDVSKTSEKLILRNNASDNKSMGDNSGDNKSEGDNPKTGDNKLDDIEVEAMNVIENDDDVNDEFLKKCKELQNSLLNKNSNTESDVDNKLVDNNEKIEISVAVAVEEQKENMDEKFDVKEKTGGFDNSIHVETSDLDFELGEIQYPERPRPVIDKKNPWGNIEFEDKIIDENASEKNENSNDFISECLNLRKKIIETSEDIDTSDETRTDEVTDGDVPPKYQKDETVQINEPTNENMTDNQKNKLLNTKKVRQILDPEEEFELDLTLEDPEKVYLLASVCRGGTICIWRSRHGRLEIELPKHFKTSKSNRKRDNTQNWISLCWAQPTLLLSSSIWHELLQWDLLPKPNKQKRFIHKSCLIHADHTRSIFSITLPTRLYENVSDEDWRTNPDIGVWTNSADRWLLRTNISNKKNVSCYTTYGGLISAISSSSLDPYKFAFASGDGSIRIWDFSKPHKQHIPMTYMFDKSHLKVTSLDWHPVRDNVLAFATNDGRIGEYDLNSRNKVPIVYSNYHRSCIYKCQWGPMINDEEKYGIYSCSRELVVHDPSKPQKEPMTLTLLEDENVTNFCWKSDYTILAVGTRTGSVILVNKQLKHIRTLYMQKKVVRCLEWHPVENLYDSNINEFSSYLAVCTNEHDIYVYDCNESNESIENKVVKLQGHVNSLRCIAWCPHLVGKLVSSCEDGYVIVWDVKTQTMLSTYNGLYENGPLVKWSPIDADLIITAGKILRIWRITKNPPKELPKTSIKKDKVSILSASESNGVTNIVVKSKAKIATKNTETKKPNPSTILCCSSKVQSGSGVEIAKNLFHRLCNDRKRDEDSSDSDSDAFEDAQDTHDGTEFTADPVKLFTNRKELLNLLEYEQTESLPRGRTFNHGIISLWKGTLPDTIKYCLENNKIDSTVINMAPMVSHKLWLECCEKYAKILVDKSHFLDASVYFLLVHKVDEAIEALCNGHLYREAVCVAKLRLPENSPMEKNILEKWAAHSIGTGLYEIGAQCYIKLGKYLEAAEILNNRTKLECLELALEIANKIQNKDLINSLNFKISSMKKETDETVQSETINICQSRFEAMVLHDTKTVNPTEIISENVQSGHSSENVQSEHSSENVQSENTSESIKSEDMKSENINSVETSENVSSEGSENVTSKSVENVI